jgi:hypothetical protein
MVNTNKSPSSPPYKSKMFLGSKAEEIFEIQPKRTVRKTRERPRVQVRPDGKLGGVGK